MKYTDSSSNQTPRIDWRILGEFELPIDAEADDMAKGRLIETLAPLGLEADFVNKILKSAQEAVLRAMRMNAETLEFEYLHVLIFSPVNPGADDHTWGFFRIEKLEKTAGPKTPRNHAVEFYLYAEGKF